jgi:oxygen-independent coproporphyrinogen-3 oxidase
MDIYLIGHGYGYAVEQMLFTLFPGERPRYPEGSPAAGSDYLVSELIEDENGKTLASRAVLSLGGKISEGRAEREYEGKLDGQGRLFDRLGQKLVRLAFFCAARPFLDRLPPWGSVTGVHPAKLASRYMEENKCGKEEAAFFLQSEYMVSPERARLCAEAAEAGLGIKRSLKPEDISLYIGIPFCPTRCSYCSFVSQSVEKCGHLIEPYLEALFGEIDAAGRLIGELELSVVSVYVGGGTPTALSAAQLEALMSRLSRSLDLSRCAEYTVEAGRPDTIDAEKLDAISRGGATRMSINPQSLNDAVLSAIGRRHSARDIIESYNLARSRFSGAINMDLIAGLPADTADSFKAGLDAVIGLGPENITVHTLAGKRGASLDFAGGAPAGADLAAEMLDYSISALNGAGYRPYYLYRQKNSAGGYENVGWCSRGHISVYIVVMMEELHNVVALGAGGVTKLVDRETGRIERIANKKYPREYIESRREAIDSKKHIREFCLAIKKHLQPT